VWAFTLARDLVVVDDIQWIEIAWQLSKRRLAVSVVTFRWTWMSSTQVEEMVNGSSTSTPTPASR
jgi:hypothetical protein